MYYFRHPDDRADWVAVHDDLAKNKSRTQIIQDLRKDLSQIEVWFSDLDGSDVDSQAEVIAFNRFFSRFCKNRSYRNWVFHSAKRCFIKKELPRSEIWQEYVDIFLRDRNELLFLHKHYTPEKILRSLFSGVREFYTDIIPQAQKYYITRNIYLIAKLFAEELGFPDHVSKIFAEEHHKGQRVQDFIEQHTFTKYGCSGDSKDDEEMHDILKFYEDKGKIEFSLTLFLASNQYLPHPKFDINCSVNRMGLVELLTERNSDKDGSV
ncbi:hypothetical protein HYX13_05985 [Candidatus Woesearchaeota archaeon]|nr:hypothetical protein [Candidatus Woesearchaeota archaeon]